MSSSSKEEVAALMSSDGDYEKKLSLLKKAVVSATRQKMEVQQQNATLSEELRRSAAELSEASSLNTTLKNRVAALEAELDRERHRSPNFGTNVLKGLASLMAGPEEGSGSPTHPGTTLPGGRKVQAASVYLSAEGVEQLMTENQNLHMQLYTLKNKHEGRAKSHHTVQEQLQREANELRGLLDEATRACDRANADSARQRAFADFCRHFFVLDVVKCDGTAEAPGLRLRATVPAQDGPGGGWTGSERPLTDPPSNVRTELASGGIERGCAMVRTLLSGVSVLIISLKNALPRTQRATVGDLRCFSDRLTTLLDAHGVEKERLTYAMEELEKSVASGADRPGPPPASSTVTRVELEVADALRRWLSLVRLHVPLLVECSVAHLPAGQSFQGLGEESGPSALTREVFVDRMTRSAYDLLSGIEGSVEALESLVSKTDNTLGAQDLDIISGEWLIALQRFWWEGCVASPQLQSSARRLAATLVEVTAVSYDSSVRDALMYISKCVVLLLSPLDTLEGRGPTETNVCASDGAAGLHPTQPLQQVSSCPCQSGSISSAIHYEELLNSLAAADRLAVCYYTQLNVAFTELAEREDACQSLERELAGTRAQLTNQISDNEQTREAMEAQIRLLSEQLTERRQQSHHPPSSQSAGAGLKATPAQRFK